MIQKIFKIATFIIKWGFALLIGIMIIFIISEYSKSEYIDYPFNYECIGDSWDYMNATYYKASLFLSLFTYIPLFLLIIFSKKISNIYFYILLILLLGFMLFMGHYYSEQTPPYWVIGFYNLFH
ncbi:MAG: hypothetical protein R3Y26_05465 [Rikenellaceae bacterium]